MIRLTLFQHKVDDTSQLVRGSGNSRRCSKPGTHATEVSAQGTVAVFQAGCGYPQSSASSILGRLHTGLNDLAAGDLIVGTQTQPGSKMLHRGPFAHIGADFAQHFLDSQFIHPIDLGQIHCPSGDKGLETDQSAPGSYAVFGCEGRVGVCRGLQVGSNSRYMRFQFCIASLQLLVIKIIQLQGLFEDANRCSRL